MQKISPLAPLHKITALAFMLVSLTLSSQTALSETPTYNVEVVIFESLANKGWTEEYWPEDIELPDTKGSTSITSTNQKPLWIKPAKANLTSEVSKLNKRGYRVIFHQAWSQQAYSNKKAPTVLIENNSSTATNLLGTMRLYKTRFAHVDFNLEFERRIPSAVLEAFAQNQKLDQADLPTHWRFNLKESRKIKPGELHYIDHPLFGVLVRIQPQ